MIRTKQIAEAFRLVAVANHYMVGFINIATKDELEQAKQILIVWSNEYNNKNFELERALDLIEMEIKGCKL